MELNFKHAFTILFFFWEGVFFPAPSRLDSIGSLARRSIHIRSQLTSHSHQSDWARGEVSLWPLRGVSPDRWLHSYRIVWWKSNIQYIYGTLRNIMRNKSLSMELSQFNWFYTQLKTENQNMYENAYTNGLIYQHSVSMGPDLMSPHGHIHEIWTSPVRFNTPLYNYIYIIFFPYSVCCILLSSMGSLEIDL